MTRPTTALLALLLSALWYGPGFAQDAPSPIAGAADSAAQEGSTGELGTDGPTAVTGVLAGRIVLTDPSKREVRTGPVVVQVVLSDTQTGSEVARATTSDDGSFRFEGLEPLHKYVVHAERSGYQPGQVETIIALDGVTEFALRLPAKKSLWWYFQAGGTLMYLLLGISILSLYIAIERGHFLLVRSRSDAAGLVARVQKALTARDFDRAIAACDETAGPVAPVLRAGLERHGHHRGEVEKAMERAGLQQVARLERGLAVLASAASIAPIVGFLGTVVGMIMAFDAIAEHGLSDPSYVADGISTALITTAAGLTVAVFALPAYHFFQTRIAIFIRQMETAATLLLETFDLMEK